MEKPERTFALLAECQKETQDAAMWQWGGRGLSGFLSPLRITALQNKWDYLDAIWQYLYNIV